MNIGWWARSGVIELPMAYRKHERANRFYSYCFGYGRNPDRTISLADLIRVVVIILCIYHIKLMHFPIFSFAGKLTRWTARKSPSAPHPPGFCVIYRWEVVWHNSCAWYVCMAFCFRNKRIIASYSWLVKNAYIRILKKKHTTAITNTVGRITPQTHPHIPALWDFPSLVLYIYIYNAAGSGLSHPERIISIIPRSECVCVCVWQNGLEPMLFGYARGITIRAHMVLRTEQMACLKSFCEPKAKPCLCAKLPN